MIRSIRMIRSVRTAAFALVCGLAAVAPSVPVAALQHVPLIKFHGQSTNWSGYAVTGHGPYSSVFAGWIQPAVDCQQTPNGYSSFWVGLDGDTTATVEQTGSEADCASGSPRYYGWYEMYPNAPVNYPNPVAPNDRMSASVTYQGGTTFQLTLTDHTQGWSQTVQRNNAGLRGSAEAIAEAPSSLFRVLPLADFGRVPFGYARVDGSALTNSTPGLDRITMESSNGTVKAQPSLIYQTIYQSAFLDTWQHQ